MIQFSTQDRQFLDAPCYLRMATLMPDGSPQITVLWYRRAGNTLHIICPEAAQKVRNLDRDPRVSALVEAPDNAHQYLEMRGTCDVVRDDARARREMVSIARRYVGERAQEFADALSADPRVVLVVRLNHLVRRGFYEPARMPPIVTEIAHR